MTRSPRTPEELAESVNRVAGHDFTILLEGAGTKRLMAGPVEAADETISTACLNRVIQYEPRDLTISVEAGLPWRELTATLAEHRQMVPLDPPFADRATVGGVVASNSSGPRRRLYGTARDLVIGMLFATVEGKLVQSGGMVVKNVAGLDMAKLMIGSFGTLAAIAVVNFKVQPMPEVEGTFLVRFGDAAAAAAARARLLTGALQPSAIDLLNPAASTALGRDGWVLAIRAGGNASAIDRYQRECTALGDAAALDGAAHDAFWQQIREFTPSFLEARPDGAVVRVSCTLKESEAVASAFPGPAVARAGTGVVYGYFDEADGAARWLAGPGAAFRTAVIEFSPDPWKRTAELWPSPGGDLEVMRRVKSLFDPGNVLNRGRMYRRI